MKKVVVRKTGEEGEYIGVFQYSEVIGESPMIGGHRGGVVSYPVVVAKISKSFKQFRLDAVDIKESQTLTIHADGETYTFGGQDLGEAKECDMGSTAVSKITRTVDYYINKKFKKPVLYKQFVYDGNLFDGPVDDINALIEEIESNDNSMLVTSDKIKVTYGFEPTVNLKEFSHRCDMFNGVKKDNEHEQHTLTDTLSKVESKIKKTIDDEPIFICWNGNVRFEGREEDIDDIRGQIAVLEKNGLKGPLSIPPGVQTTTYNKK